jgi:endogenous inhibitor of DNA gyrase (YacG/DUF329 family)
MTANASNSKFVYCPACAKEIIWSDTNPFRPFCSEKCRLIDLGDWLSEKHFIYVSEEED